MKSGGVQNFAKLGWGVLFALSLFVLGGCTATPPQDIQPVSPFSLDRYLGLWFEQARLDHSFERGMSHVTAEYRLQNDGSVQVLNRGYLADKKTWKEAEGRAVFIGASDVAALKVSFFGPFYGGYFVAALDKDYRWALVVGPNRDYFWILTRERILPDETRVELVAKAEALGIDTSKLIWVDQTQPKP
ncbi:MAG: lipocalin family protein [Halothiobacillaceae bacterium]